MTAPTLTPLAALGHTSWRPRPRHWQHGAAALLLAVATPALADWTSLLSPRDINGDGAIDAWHDSGANLTWLADWSQAPVQSWQDGTAWAGALDVHGVTGWRLPTTLQPDPGCSGQIGAGPSGYGFGCGGELGGLWHGTLGNPVGGPAASAGPFSGFTGSVWGGAADINYNGSPSSSMAWAFDTASGYQFLRPRSDATGVRALAVIDGDVPGAVAPPPVPPPAAVQIHSATFTGAGGDVRWGTGDNTSVSLVTGLLPLFDTDLGTLQRVDVTLRGWRSIAFTCTTGVAGSPGGCNARAGGNWVLDSVNYPQWSFLTLATLYTGADVATGMAPPPGQSISALSMAENSVTVSFSDTEQLRKHFTDETGSAPMVDFRLYFQGLDGGSIGQGGASGITHLLWDGDASVVMSYHYAAAVPEPSAWALMAAGLGALGWLRRRRGPTGV